ncbi:MAG: helix-turn-helix transcriptional regulator [Vulcanimicrobiaceae bacterium]
MSVRNSELASFLKSRRQRLTPEQLGLPQSARRRVSCLRREEVAWVADVGITWYTWLEQGRPIKIAAETLDRIAAALRLDFSETEYLRKLVQPRRKGPHPWEAPVERRVRSLVEGYTSGLALVIGPRWDILAWNKEFAKLFDLDEQTADLERNWLWIMFTQDRPRLLFPDWDTIARQTVAVFRVEHADYVGNASFEELIDALCARSSDFASHWSDVDVLSRTRWSLGKIKDPRSGMILTFQTVTLPIPESPGQTLIFHYPAGELKLPENPFPRQFCDLAAGA